MTKKYFSANINWIHFLHHCIIVSLSSLVFRYARNYVWGGIYCSHFLTDIFFHYPFSAGTNDIGRQIHARSHLMLFPNLFYMVIVVELLVHIQLFCNPMDCSPPGFSFHVIFPGKNTGVGCHSFFQGIFLTQGLNRGLLHYSKILYNWATGYGH